MSFLRVIASGSEAIQSFGFQWIASGYRPRNDGDAIYVIARNEAIYDDVLDCFGCFVPRNDVPSQ